MKAWKRVLVKVLVLLLIVLLFGGGAACLRAYQQSTPDYAMEQYLGRLIENDADRAYTLLDQSQDTPITSQEYAAALEARKYSLYSEYELERGENRRDSDGNEYVDYHARFLNADGEVQYEEDFTVRKQADAAFGILDRWRILSGHCMVKNFRITVPAGSELYLDNEPADAAWIVTDGVAASYDCYEVPSLLPGEISVAVRHPALESVNTTLDTTAGSADYTAQMALKTSAQNECKEMAVNALKQLYAGAATESTDGLETLFADSLTTAEDFVESQGTRLHQDGSVFRNAAISDFAAQFGDLQFTEGEDGAITTEMTFSYHYVVRQDVTTDTEELQEDGTPVQQTETASQSGDNTATFVMSFADGAWSIASFEIPVIPENA